MPSLQPIQTFPSPGEHLCGLAFDGEMLWHSDGMAEEIYRIALPAGNVVRTIPCPGLKTDLAWDGQYLWQVVGSPKYLRCLDPVSGKTVRELPLPCDSDNACGVAVAGEQFWLGVELTGKLQLRSLADGSVILEFPARRRIAGVTVAAGSVWYCEAMEGLLVRVNPTDGAVAGEYHIGGMPTGLTWDGCRFWVADFTARAIKAFVLPD